MFDWAKIGLYILGLLKWLTDRVSLKDAEDLGRLKEAERNAQANTDLADRIRSVDPDSVPDDEAFGDSGHGNAVPGAEKK